MKLNQLAKRIQKGDRTAYREVADQYGKMVFYTAQAELDDRDHAVEASRRVLGSFFELLRKGEVPDDPTKYLQRAVRYECRNIGAEEIVMSDLLAAIQVDSDVDMIFADLVQDDAAGREPSASAHPVSPSAATVAMPAQPAPAPAPSVTPAAVIAAQVPPVEDAAQAPTAREVASAAAPVVPEATAQMPVVPEGTPEPVLDDHLASKDSELYQQFYGQAEALGKRKSHIGMFFGVLFTIVLIVILAWLVCGILMRMGVVTGIPDLGYIWFDQNVFPLF